MDSNIIIIKHYDKTFSYNVFNCCSSVKTLTIIYPMEDIQIKTIDTNAKIMLEKKFNDELKYFKELEIYTPIEKTDDIKLEFIKEYIKLGLNIKILTKEEVDVLITTNKSLPPLTDSQLLIVFKNNGKFSEYLCTLYRENFEKMIELAEKSWPIKEGASSLNEGVNCVEIKDVYNFMYSIFSTKSVIIYTLFCLLRWGNINKYNEIKFMRYALSLREFLPKVDFMKFIGIILLYYTPADIFKEYIGSKNIYLNYSEKLYPRSLKDICRIIVQNYSLTETYINNIQALTNPEMYKDLKNIFKDMDKTTNHRKNLVKLCKFINLKKYSEYYTEYQNNKDTKNRITDKSFLYIFKKDSPHTNDIFQLNLMPFLYNVTNLIYVDLLDYSEIENENSLYLHYDRGIKYIDIEKKYGNIEFKKGSSLYISNITTGANVKIIPYDPNRIDTFKGCMNILREEFPVKDYIHFLYTPKANPVFRTISSIISEIYNEYNKVNNNKLLPIKEAKTVKKVKKLKKN